MARSSLALFLAGAGLIAGLSGCGGEGPRERPEGAADQAKPSLGAPDGGKGDEGGEEGERQRPESLEAEGGEGGEGGEN
jgi:hypothetical protein